MKFTDIIFAMWFLSILTIAILIVASCAGWVEPGGLSATVGVVAIAAFIILLIPIGVIAKTEEQENLDKYQEMLDSSLNAQTGFHSETSAHTQFPTGNIRLLAFSNVHNSLAMLEVAENSSGISANVIDGGEILEAEITVNDKTINQTDTGSLAKRAVGGALLGGGAGAVVGAVSAQTESKSFVETITIELITNRHNSRKNYYELEYFKRSELSESENRKNEMAEEALQIAKNDYAKIRSMMHTAQQDTNTSSNDKPSEESTDKNSADEATTANEPKSDVLADDDDAEGTVAELQKVIEMHEQGHLTEEEFKQMKKQVLNENS